jgi:signal peptidase II
MPRATPWFALAAALVILDQLTKWLVLQRFEEGGRYFVTEFLNLVLVYNRGAAFSFLADASGWQTPLLVAFALGAAVFVSVLLVRSPGRTMLCTGLALILGGALGNVIDRLRLGKVVDFIDLHAFGWHWPAFNVADAGITMGAAILILEAFLHKEAGGAKHA